MEEFDKIIKEIDDNFIGIKEGFDDNAVAHTNLNECIVTLNQAIEALHERLSAVEKYLSEMATPDRILYKPKGGDDYLDMKGNYDHIYDRISKLEDK